MKNNKRNIVMMASIILIVAVSIFGTIAYLKSKTPVVENTFDASNVPNEVVETIDGNVKKDVAIRNEGNIDAYVRAVVVVTWAEVDANGEPTKNVYSEKPVPGQDYNIEKPGNWKWVEAADGYYYYTLKVAPNRNTEELFSQVSQLSEKEGYVLSVEIMGQTIQALPDSVVGSVWSNDKVTVAGNDGVLTVTNK